MPLEIKKAVKYGSKLKMSLYGPSSSGKTYTALSLAQHLAGDKRILVIDTERKSAEKYADVFDFDTIQLGAYHPTRYVEAIRLAASSPEHSVLIIDSISHEWDGPGGALELAGQNFTNWAKVTPLHNAFVDAMMNADMHLIATIRAKEEYAMKTAEGKSKPEVYKVGMEPIQRKGMHYEFDIVGSLDLDNTLTIEKTRCSAIQGGVYHKAGRELAETLNAWLSGTPAPEPATPAQPASTDKRSRLNDLFARGKEKALFTDTRSMAAFIADALESTIILPANKLVELSDDELYRVELAVSANAGLNGAA